MKPTIEILEKINQNSKLNKEEVFTKLFRYLLREDIYFIAYKKLYANKGAGTEGINDDTVDGFSVDKIKKIIESLKNGSYNPFPTKRTYISKKNNPSKKRPLGLPTFTDKLIQEVIRMVLESIYEPLFSNSSHGFRPERSCHTALKSMRYGFSGVKWFVEGDIKGCFDNINHEKLIKILERKIKDARFLQVIYKFLKAGYLEDWVYHNTISGTPQGGIISPILANIYLNELDKFVENSLKEKFHKPVGKKTQTQEYTKISIAILDCKRKIKKLEGQARLDKIEELHKLQKQKLKTPTLIQNGTRILYVRYCDDFIIGVDGSKEICVEIKTLLKEFISNELKMELSEEKTLITHSSNKARFLGYDISIRRNGNVKRKVVNGKNVKQRTLRYQLALSIPFENIQKFLFSKNVVAMKNGAMFPIKRNSLLRLTDLEIIHTFNSELRGICNYYNLACDYNNLDYFAYCMEYSCLKTLARKYKTHIGKIKSKFNHGKKWGIPYETRNGNKIMYFTSEKECKTNTAIDQIPKAEWSHKGSRTTFEKRLKAEMCELCGEKGKLELHHTNKVKNLKGKQEWEKVMIAKRRKTLAVCHSCHMKIHHNS